MVEFSGEDDGHDDAVDGDDLAEDDGDEVLGADARCFDTAAEDGGAGYEYAPIGVDVESVIDRFFDEEGHR